MEGKRVEGSHATSPCSACNPNQFLFEKTKKRDNREICLFKHLLSPPNSQHFPLELGSDKRYITGFTGDLIKRLINISIWRNRSRVLNNTVFPLVLTISSENRTDFIDNIFAKKIAKVHFLSGFEAHLINRLGNKRCDETARMLLRNGRCY
jgi:hypothetical protein